MDTAADSVGSDDAVRRSEQQYRLLFERNPNPMWVFSSATLAFLAVNDAAVEKYGYTRAEFMGMTLRDVRPVEDLPALERVNFIDSIELRVSARHVTGSGGLLHVEIESHPLEFDGQSARLAFVLDVTDRQRAEVAATEGMKGYRTLFENVPVGLCQSTPQGAFLDVNPALVSMLGYPDRETLLAAPVMSLYVDPSARDRWREQVDRTGESRDFEVHLRRYDGGLIWVRHTSSACRGDDGNVLYYEGVMQDITEQRRMESDRGFRTAILEAQTEASLDGILVVDDNGRIVSYNRRFAEMWNIPLSVLVGGSDAEALAVVDSAVVDQESFRARIAHLYTNPAEESRDEIVLTDGRVFDRYSAPVRSRHGGFYGRVWYFRDVTTQRLLESQLLQASKMEAVGKLAGGVAHDFNNILTAIQGQAQLLLDELDVTSTTHADVREIEVNARRAADLTRQLLAFSRQQMLQPHILQLGEIVNGMAPMLRRLIGSHIAMDYTADADASCVRADPSQIEQIVLNLAVNAAHAMPSGGQLSITISNETLDQAYSRGFDYPVAPGDYVRLAVVDTGEGMDVKTKARIFEPFFTTKEQGQGTGLGLSTVYGVVKQSGGYIWVDSERGAGTAFRVYLPAVAAAVASEPVIAPAPIAMPGVDTTSVVGETIIVCEDEDPVRLLVQRVLERKGYIVLAAATPDAALRIATEHPGPVSLLLTDIVLPQMGGRELARQVQLIRPDIQTILMSGYSEADLSWSDDPDASTPFLQKPFTPARLAAAVAQVLRRPDGRTRTTPAAAP